MAAYEITIRVGNAVNIAEHYAKGFHPTATAGTFGAAAGVAKFLGLDARGIQMALGLAGSQAAGSLAYLQNGSWGKRFNAGWAAHSGVMAALMAKSGMTGPDDILAGPNGFLQGYTEHPLLRRLTEGLGKSYAIEEVAVKPYGCCRYSHSAIDGALALRGRGLVPSQIREMQILLPRPALLLVGEPEKLKRAPETPVDAQFSVHYATLVALENGHAEPEDFVEPKLFVQRHSEIRSVHAKVSPECDSVFPQHWATRLIVETKDGRHWEEFVTDPKGSQYNPMTWEEVVSKFKRLTSSLPPSTQEELINGCRGLKDGSVHPYSIIKRLETSEARQ